MSLVVSDRVCSTIQLRSLAGEHLVDQPQRHQRIMPGIWRGRTSRSWAVRTVSGTHKRPGAGYVIALAAAALAALRVVRRLEGTRPGSVRS
jgi:hypothetical protein